MNAQAFSLLKVSVTVRTCALQEDGKIRSTADIHPPPHNAPDIRLRNQNLVYGLNFLDNTASIFPHGFIYSSEKNLKS